MVATFELHISYRDPCWHDTARITVYTAGEICAEICRTSAYEAHWARHHTTIDGPFPFPAGTFPSRSFIQGCITKLTINQRKLVYHGRVGDAAYIVTVRRIA